MPTADDFLRTASPLSKDEASTAECGICHHRDLMTPIRTECGHIFDRHCVIRWLLASMLPRTCPICRHVWVDDIGGGMTIEHILGPKESWHRFGVPLGYPPSQIHERDQNVSTYSIEVDLRWIRNATVHVYVEKLAEDVVSFGNLVIAQAIYDGNPMGTEELDIWKRVVAAAWTSLRRLDGTPTRVDSLKDTLIYEMCCEYYFAGRIEEINNVLQKTLVGDTYVTLPNTLGSRTRALVNFIAWQVWHTFLVESDLLETDGFDILLSPEAKIPLVNLCSSYPR